MSVVASGADARSQTPIDAVSARPCANGRARMAARTRSAAARVSAADASGSSQANSSPPMRPTDVDRARLGRDALRGLGEDAVADRMAVLVVDRLEVVEVDDDEPERPAAGGQALGLLGQPRGERAVVEQAGEPVAVGLADELGLARGLGGAVVDGDELGGVAAGERARDDGDRRAPPPAVTAGERDLDRAAPGRGGRDPRRRRAPGELAGGVAGEAVRGAVGDEHLAVGDDEHAVAQAVEGGERDGVGVDDRDVEHRLRR